MKNTNTLEFTGDYAKLRKLRCEIANETVAHRWGHGMSLQYDAETCEGILTIECEGLVDKKEVNDIVMNMM